MKTLSTLELSYLAGFVDGDGCINAQIVRRHDYLLKFQIRVSVTFFQHKKRKWLLEKIEHQVGTGTIRTRPDDMCEYAIVGPENVKKFLLMLQPYIRGKRRQLELVLIIISRLTRKQSKEDFLQLCKIADHFVVLNDSKKREVTSKTVEETWKESDKRIN